MDHSIPERLWLCHQKSRLVLWRMWTKSSPQSGGIFIATRLLLSSPQRAKCLAFRSCGRS